jgi:NAD(P)-dependent dehydrogenase (short-subunit alcohol dehydrogenase family)
MEAKLGSDAVACNGDVAEKDFGERIVKTAVDTFGDAHIVVNNAGFTWDNVIQKMTDEQIRREQDLAMMQLVLEASENPLRRDALSAMLEKQGYRMEKMDDKELTQSVLRRVEEEVDPPAMRKFPL